MRSRKPLQSLRTVILILALLLATCGNPPTTQQPGAGTAPPTLRPTPTTLHTLLSPTPVPALANTPAQTEAPDTTPLSPAAQPANLPTASVVRVIDGDTVDVRLEGQVVRLRLIGIDTPEVVDPRRPVECFGREASAKAHELLDGQTVAAKLTLARMMWTATGGCCAISGWRMAACSI